MSSDTSGPTAALRIKEVQEEYAGTAGVLFAEDEDAASVFVRKALPTSAGPGKAALPTATAGVYACVDRDASGSHESVFNGGIAGVCGASVFAGGAEQVHQSVQVSSDTSGPTAALRIKDLHEEYVGTAGVLVADHGEAASVFCVRTALPRRPTANSRATSARRRLRRSCRRL